MSSRTRSTRQGKIVVAEVVTETTTTAAAVKTEGRGSTERPEEDGKMKNEDEPLSMQMESNASSSSSNATMTPRTGTSRTGTSRTSPTCARCSNHDLKIELKNHKRYCKYRYCNCDKCQLTMERQQVMAKQTAMRRAAAQDEKKVRSAHEQVEPTPFGAKGGRSVLVPQPSSSLEGSYDSSSGDSPISNHGSNGMHTGIGSTVSIPAWRKLHSMHSHIGTTHVSQSHTSENVEMLLEYSTKLLELFQYPWEALTLMYMVVKDSGANLEEIVKRIVEANAEIRALPFWKAVRMVQNGRTYFCTGCAASPGSVGAPTYEGPVPYIGVVPPSSADYLRLFSHPLNAHVPTARVPSSPDSPLEHSAT